MIVIEASSSLFKVANNSKLLFLSWSSNFAVLGFIFPSFTATILKISFFPINVILIVF
jgi:hypothetical protein